MEDTNYDEIRRRRQERRMEEHRKRQQRVHVIVGILIVLVLAVAIAAAVYVMKKGSDGNGGANSTVAESTKAEETTAAADSEAAGGETTAAADSEAAGGETTAAAESEAAGGETTAAAGSEAAGEETTAAEETSAAPAKKVGGFFAWLKGLFRGSDKGLAVVEKTPEAVTDSEIVIDANGDTAAADSTPADPSDPKQQLLDQAAALAAGYDYDGAIALLQGSADFAADEAVTAAVAQYEEIKSTLVAQDISKITHVFFHSLVMDNSKAFDGDSHTKGYNQVMTTRSEFEKILTEMYNRGYVLVKIHDMAYEETQADGTVKMVRGNIMLPPGKQAFVMSQDDVCYYPYMDGDGFANRIVIGEDGKPTCEMKMEDGSVQTGSFDLVPLLEDFIKEHPDFSYKGARAIIAFTGYEGILGYRTAASYAESNPNYEADRQTAAAVAQNLRDNGWELASHSWGHRQLGQIDMTHFTTDCDKWEAEVESLIGPTDIILYPFGDDIADWHPYTTENERYTYLHNLGFRYFCNVDSNEYWVQVGDDFLRQGRRNLDGYRMWQDILVDQTGEGTKKLADLFDAKAVFDPDRPTPVEWE